jgi:hypothetical protein
MAFYMKGDRIIEIREQISFTDLRDYRRAKDGRAPKAVLETIKAAQEGFTEDPVRERRLTIKVEYEDVSLDIPSDAVPGSLGPALDASGIGKLFKAPATMRTGRGATPVTSPSPAASASPELSPPAS